MSVNSVSEETCKIRRLKNDYQKYLILLILLIDILIHINVSYFEKYSNKHYLWPQFYLTFLYISLQVKIIFNFIDEHNLIIISFSQQIKLLMISINRHIDYASSSYPPSELEIFLHQKNLHAQSIREPSLPFHSSSYLNSLPVQSILNILQQQFQLMIEGHTDLIYDLAITSDSLFIVSGSKDKTIRIWNLLTAARKQFCTDTLIW